jgi:hypothetical protein
MLQSQSIIYDQNSETGFFEKRKNPIDYGHIRRMPFLHLFDERKIKIVNKVPGWISLCFIGKNLDGKITPGIVGQELKYCPNFYSGKVSESREKGNRSYSSIIYQKNTALIIYYFQRLSKSELRNELAEYFVHSFNEFS